MKPQSPRRFEQSNALEQRARAVIPGVTQTISKRPESFALGSFPTYIDHGQGSHVWDIDGNEYVDFVMACGPATLGYCHPEVDRAIMAQLQRGIIFSRLTALEVEVAELLTALVPCAEMVRFFKGGAEANSAALRIARGATGREMVVSCGYRGWHDQFAINQNPRGVPGALASVMKQFQYNDLASLEEVLNAHPNQVAAVIIDPLSGQPPAEGFLAGVKELAHRHGALLIFDEIVTGFRVATGGAQEYFGVTPDMAVFAKGIANGMPLAAVTGPRDVMRVAADLLITLTYGDESLSLAAAKAALTIYQQHDICGHIWQIGQAITDGVREVIAETGAPFGMGGLAPMPAFFCTGEFRGRTLSANEQQRVWFYIMAQMAQRGVIWRRHSLLLPSYAHTDDDVDLAVAACGEVFSELVERLAAGTLEEVAPFAEAPGFRRL